MGELHSYVIHDPSVGRNVYVDCTGTSFYEGDWVRNDSYERFQIESIDPVTRMVRFAGTIRARSVALLGVDYLPASPADGGVSNVTSTKSPVAESNPYSELRRVLNLAYDQAATGKGNERHACGEPFDEQLICIIGRQLNNTGFQVGQAVKKAIESTRLPPDRAIQELLGSVNYLAAAILLLEEKRDKKG